MLCAHRSCNNYVDIDGVPCYGHYLTMAKKKKGKGKKNKKKNKK